MKLSGAVDFNAPALNYARTDFPLLEADASVEKALAAIRREGIGERVIYFYAVDERKRLVGVVPTRRLFTASPLRGCGRTWCGDRFAGSDCSEACEFFILYKPRISGGGCGAAIG
jgi:magnesium transporter